MKYILLIIIALNSGCGYTIKKGGDRYIEPEMAHYVTVFEDITGQRVGSDLEFEPILGPINGQCRINKYGQRLVVIDPSFWEIADYDARLALVIHELLHCEYKVEHGSDYDQNGVGLLMSPATSNSIDCIRKLGINHCIQVALGK